MNKPVIIDDQHEVQSATHALPKLELMPSDYDEHLKKFDLTDAEAQELLAVLWDCMRMMAEMSWGLDLVQTFSAAKGEFSSLDSVKPDKSKSVIPPE